MTLPYDEVTLAGGAVLRVHASDKCAGQSCAVHNPSHHVLRYAPLLWRSSTGLMERECIHKIGHPDPDALAFLVRVRGESADVLKYHGCDGCCQEPVVVECEKRALPQKPVALPLVLVLASRVGTIARDFSTVLALLTVVAVLDGYQEPVVFILMLVTGLTSLTTTFLVHHYKERHSQYFRRSKR